MVSYIVSSFVLSLALLINAASAAESWESNPLVATDVNLLRILRGLRQDVRTRGCNANICFALQGDNFVNAAEFQAQKNVVDLIAGILLLDNPIGYAAVQYGRTTRGMSRLTDRRLTFLRRVENRSRVGGFNTNIAAALGYCGFHLRSQVGDANKVVLFGDGLETVGFAPKRVANRIFRDGTDICAVAVGGFDIASLTEITRDAGKVLQIDDFFELGEIVVGLVNGICGF